MHTSRECAPVIDLWQQLATFFGNNLILLALTPRAALLGLWDGDTNHDELIIIYTLLIFKLHAFNSRENIV